MLRWRRIVHTLILLGCINGYTDVSRGYAQNSAGPFASSRVQLSLGGGSSQLASVDYLILRGQASYFMIDGLSADLGLQTWIALDDEGDHVFMVSPGLSYFVYQLSPLVPYVGAFYQRAFTALPLESLDAVGARGGFIFQQGYTLIGLGARMTQALGCAEDCVQITPEITLQISF